VPGKQVSNWKVYHALRNKRYMSKSVAARIVNARYASKRRRRKK